MSEPEASNKIFSGMTSLTFETQFQFSCHAKVACFNSCCSNIDLLLSPYDVLCLRQALALSGGDFLSRYGEIDRARGTHFPLISLRMLADERGLCPFVNTAGCSVYQNRPAACRLYPIGRQVSFNDLGEVYVHWGLIKEPHCLGFNEEQNWNIADWLAAQEVDEAITFVDRLAKLIDSLNRRRIVLSGKQVEQIVNELYLKPQLASADKNGSHAENIKFEADWARAIMELGQAFEVLERDLLG